MANIGWWSFDCFNGCILLSEILVGWLKREQTKLTSSEFLELVKVEDRIRIGKSIEAFRVKGIFNELFDVETGGQIITLQAVIGEIQRSDTTIVQSGYGYMKKVFERDCEDAPVLDIKDASEAPYPIKKTIQSPIYLHSKEKGAGRSYIDFAVRMKSLLSVGKCTLWEYDIVAKQTIRSEEFSEQLGVPSYFKDITTVKRLDCLHPEDLNRYLCFMKRLASGHCDEDVAEFRYIDEQQRLYWIKWGYFCCKRNENGSPQILIGATTNITEDKHKEERLTSLEIRYQKIIEAVPDSIFLYSRNLKIVDIYSAVEEDMVAHSSKLKGRYLQDFMPADFIEMISHKITSVLENGELQEFTYSVRVRKEVRYFESRMLPFDKDMVICFIHNVNDRKREEARNRELTELMDTILTYLPVNVYVKDTGDDFKYLYWNRAAENQTGVSAK